MKLPKPLVNRGVNSLAALLLFATLCTQILNMQPAFADDGGYPWIGATQLNASTSDYGYYPSCPSNASSCMSIPYSYNGHTYGEMDAYGYVFRNCTSYVAWEIKQVFPSVTFPSNLGDASTWASKAQTDHFGTVYPSSGYTPQVGDIAVWTSADHVAYVSGVSGSGVASLYEYNVGYDGLFYSNRTTASNPPGTPDHYIHVGSVGTAPYAGVGSATFFGSSQLNNGQTLQDGYYLTSGNVQYALIMQADGNLVLYSGSGALWASNTSGNPGAYVGVQSDGNIVIYNSSGQAIWATNTNGQSTSYLAIQTDGNLVAYNTSGTAVWASNTGGHPTDTYYGADRAYNGATVNGGYYIRSSDLRYAVMMQSDGNLVLYGPGYHVLWANNENGNPGAYLGLQSDGNIVEYSSSGHALWATNTSGQSLNYLVMQSDGNLVAYNTSGSAIWATGTNGKI